VDAPDGTLAMPTVPSAKKTDASTVGFPLDSNISRAQHLMICGLFMIGKAPSFFTVSVKISMVRKMGKYARTEHFS
jgi:hypothetical protein